MVVGLIIRLLLYSIALIFGISGLIYTGSGYGMGTRIGGLGLVFAALAILPITRRIILNKFGISIGAILAIAILAVAIFGFGSLSATPSEVEIGDIQTNVSDDNIEVLATFSNPQSQKVPLKNINTTLTIEEESQETQVVWQQISHSIGANTTETHTVLNIYRTNSSDSQVTVEFRNEGGSVVGETAIDSSHWSAIQDGEYSVVVNFYNRDTTYTPTNTTTNVVESNNIIQYNNANTL